MLLLKLAMGISVSSVYFHAIKAWSSISLSQNHAWKENKQDKRG
jgi:hypothetical protein